MPQTTRGAPAHRLRSGPSWLGAAVASLTLFALLGIGHLLPAFHFARVAHRICAEHGELVHDTALARNAAAPADTSSLVLGQHAGHEHEHCGALALPGPRALLPSTAERVHVSGGGRLTSSAGGELAAHVGVALLAYAPKLAPPA